MTQIEASAVPRRRALLAGAVAALALVCMGCTIRAPTPRSSLDRVGSGASAPPAALPPLPARGPTDEPQLESFALPGTSIELQRATVAVDAPVARVREVVFDYPRYPEFMPNYRAAQLLETTPAGARVIRWEISELGGLVKLWIKVGISPVIRTGDVESYDGSLLGGNVKAFQSRWELEPLGPARTRLSLESMMDPAMALIPNSLINDGSRDGLRAAILALKARAESR